MLFNSAASRCTNLSVRANPSDPFWFKPYLQLTATDDALLLSWFSESSSHEHRWRLEVRQNDIHDPGPTSGSITEPGSSWKTLPFRCIRRFTYNMATVSKFEALLPLSPQSCRPEYRINLDEKLVFSAWYKNSSLNGRTKAAILGDLVAEEEGSRQLAAPLFCALYEEEPDYIVLAGDIVYPGGEIANYLFNLQPLLNNDTLDSSFGAPLLRSIPVVAAIGNHDLDFRSKGKETYAACMDNQGFFLFWKGTNGGPKLRRTLLGRLAWRTRLGRKFSGLIRNELLSRTCFTLSFRHHQWCIVDGNEYTDWLAPEMKDWLLSSVELKEKLQWCFVCCHQPGFNSDLQYRSQQQNRRLAELIQDKVQLIFYGHCHHYERTYPLIFHSFSKNVQRPGLEKVEEVPGELVIDSSFDGLHKKRFHGTVHLITGAGGQLSSPDRRPSTIGASEFTTRFVDDRLSFTLLHVGSDQILVQQLATADYGDSYVLVELDSFFVQK